MLARFSSVFRAEVEPAVVNENLPPVELTLSTDNGYQQFVDTQHLSSSGDAGESAPTRDDLAFVREFLSRNGIAAVCGDESVGVENEAASETVLGQPSYQHQVDSMQVIHNHSPTSVPESTSTAVSPPSSVDTVRDIGSEAFVFPEQIASQGMFALPTPTVSPTSYGSFINMTATTPSPVYSRFQECVAGPSNITPNNANVGVLPQNQMGWSHPMAYHPQVYYPSQEQALATPGPSPHAPAFHHPQFQAMVHPYPQFQGYHPQMVGYANPTMMAHPMYANINVGSSVTGATPIMVIQNYGIPSPDGGQEVEVTTNGKGTEVEIEKSTATSRAKRR